MKFNNILENDPIVTDLCYSSPCGSNADCFDGICKCRPEFSGDPYIGCRPECVGNEECPFNKACIHNKCIDPCIGTCGFNAQCLTSNHIPNCICPAGTSGNAFISCNQFEGNILHKIFESEKNCCICIPIFLIFYHSCRNSSMLAISLWTK